MVKILWGKTRQFNVPYQTEKEEAETSENAEDEHLADESAIERKKRGED